MLKEAVLQISDGKTGQAIIGLLKSLLEKGVVEVILVPKGLPSGDGVVQTLVHDPEKLNGVSILSPTIPVQSARVASSLSAKNLGKKVAALLKPCEIRAVVELIKFLQVKLHHLYLIGMDCPGTFEVPEYARMAQEGKGGDRLTDELLRGMEKGDFRSPEGYAFRTACQMCEYPVPKADMVFRLFGYKAGQEIGVEVVERLAREIEGKGILSLSEVKEPAGRGEALARIIAERTKRRDVTFMEFKGAMKDLRSFLDRFSTCIRCHNCMVACPICYCKECVFRTAIFEHEGDQFVRWAERKGGIRMPTDTLIFHLMRMSHMATSCVGCGLCDSACPSRLPVATLFRAVGDRVQKMFQYVPGRDEKEVPPVATFREDELKIESGAI